MRNYRLPCRMHGRRNVTLDVAVLRVNNARLIACSVSFWPTVCLAAISMENVTALIMYGNAVYYVFVMSLYTLPYHVALGGGRGRVGVRFVGRRIIKKSLAKRRRATALYRQQQFVYMANRNRDN